MSEIPHIQIKRERCSSDGWCVHYAGMIDRGVKPITHCEAGIRYDSVITTVYFTYSYNNSATKYTSHKAHPCFKHEFPLTNGCPSCRFKTPEEIAEYHKNMDAGNRRLTDARNAVVEEIKSTGRKQGATDCPVCKGSQTLSFSQASNGHIHARCSVKDCVEWME